MVCVKTSLDFSNIDVTLHASSNLEVLGIAVHSFSIFNIYIPLTSTSFDFYPTLQKVFSAVILTLAMVCREASTQTAMSYLW